MKTNHSSYIFNKNLLEDFFKNSSQLELKHEILRQGENPIFSWFKHTGYIQPHKYIIYRDSQAIGSITEQISSKLWFFISHIILKSHRPLHFILQDNKRNPLLIFHRPFYFWLSQSYTKDVRGRDIGRVQQKFSITHKKYHLFTNHAHPFGFIKSFLTKFWTFPILNSQRQSIGEIKKKWGGGIKEMLTEADHFNIQMSDIPLEKKIMILSAVINIDFDHFENHNN